MADEGHKGLMLEAGGGGGGEGRVAVEGTVDRACRGGRAEVQQPSLR